MADVPVWHEEIDAQIERAERSSNAALLRVAFLRRYVREAETREGRTNGFYTEILNNLIRHAQASLLGEVDD